MTRLARRVGFLFAVLALASAPAGRAEAGIITTVGIGANREDPGVIDTLRFSFGASPDGLTFQEASIALTAGDVGSVLSLAAPASLFVLLTNGADDFLRTVFEAVGSPLPPDVDIALESAFFTDPAIPGPDLQGFDLSRISLRVDSLQFRVIRRGDQDFTETTFAGTLIFEDGEANPVPAPPSAVLAGIAGLMVFARAVRRRRAA